MRLLIITHTFPPSKHSNAKRPFLVASSALKEGWEVDVLTSNIGFQAGSVETLRHSSLTITRLDDPVIRLLGKLSNNSRIALLLMKCVNGILWPDYCANWVKLVKRRADGFGAYDRILAFVFPPSILRLGESKGLVGSNWIFDYQESVTPQFAKFPRRSLIQRWRTKRLRNLERDTLHEAGKVIFTAASNRDAYINSNLVPSEKSEHIPYFFESNTFSQPADTDGGFGICYFGGFDLHGERNPHTFLKALAGFLSAHPDAKAHTKFHFYGTWQEAHTEFIKELGLENQFEPHSPLSYEAYLHQVKASPVLLLVVASAHNLFMPSKIVDYFGARRPVLAFVPGESEMRAVLEQAEMTEFACGESDVQAGIRAIEKLWEDFKNGRLGHISAQTKKWSSSHQVPRYLELIRKTGRDSVLLKADA